MTITKTTKRILTAATLGAIGIGVVACEYFGINATRWAAIAVVLGMCYELFSGIYRAKLKNKSIVFAVCCLLFALLVCAAYAVGGRPWIMLLLLCIIAAADTGAWFFGHLIGGDKMWEHLSPNKTWAGQIAGIICGTIASVMYGLLGTDIFLPQLLWIGISIALLSQYGDMTESWIKRKLGIKDMGNLLPGHGGLFDRFDGWIYVLPLVWLVML